MLSLYLSVTAARGVNQELSGQGGVACRNHQCQDQQRPYKCDFFIVRSPFLCEMPKMR